MKKVILIIASFAFFSATAYADSSTDCYQIGDTIQCNTQNAANGSGLLGGLNKGIANFKQQRYASQQQQTLIQQIQNEQAQATDQENIKLAQEENTRKFLDSHPDVTFRSSEYNKIADLIEIGYSEDEAYKRIMRPSLDEIFEKSKHQPAS